MDCWLAGWLADGSPLTLKYFLNCFDVNSVRNSQSSFPFDFLHRATVS